MGADWRFLLPIDRHSRLLVIQDARDESCRWSLRELDMPLTVWRPRALAQAAAANASAEFDVIAAPLGLRTDASSGERMPSIEAHRTVRRLLRPNGAFLIGFSNRWGLRRAGRHVAMPSSPREMTALLRAQGYAAIALFGAVPDACEPEYIFPLHPQSLSFVMRHRYRHHLPGYLLSRRPVLSDALLRFLPAYYAVARLDAAT